MFLHIDTCLLKSSGQRRPSLKKFTLEQKILKLSSQTSIIILSKSISMK